MLLMILLLPLLFQQQQDVMHCRVTKVVPEISLSCNTKDGLIILDIPRNDWFNGFLLEETDKQVTDFFKDWKTEPLRKGLILRATYSDKGFPYPLPSCKEQVRRNLEQWKSVHGYDRAPLSYNEPPTDCWRIKNE